MDSQQLTTLVQIFQQSPDPRCARGLRHQWWVLLTIIATGLLCGQRTFRAIAQSARYHEPLLRRYLPLWQGHVPSAKTLQRAMDRLDLEVFEQQAAAYVSATGEPTGGEPADLALDGKTLRGASHGGRKVHLLTLASHGHGTVLVRHNVSVKENEIVVAPRVLSGQRLGGRVITGDAMFCQRTLIAQVRAQGGHHLWEVKTNQPAPYADLAALFEAPRRGPHPLDFRSASELSSGHGRIDERSLEASDALNDYLDWRGLQQVLRRTCTRHIRGETTVEDHFYVTSLSPEAADPRRLLDLTRRHWGIENHVNRARDVVFGEDASTSRTGTGPEAMSVMRDLVMHLLHQRAGHALTDRLRYYQAYPAKALVALGLRRL